MVGRGGGLGGGLDVGFEWVGLGWVGLGRSMKVGWIVGVTSSLLGNSWPWEFLGMNA